MAQLDAPCSCASEEFAKINQGASVKKSGNDQYLQIVENRKVSGGVSAETRKIGPALIFQRLWEELAVKKSWNTF